ncbi:MAG: hypothetical protein U0263_29735, partial [Polyangiaceae bacterium]
YVITQRNGKNHWTRIGVGFVNRDGSINLKLDAVPVSGELQLRDQVPREGSLSLLPRANGKDLEGAAGLSELG